MLSDNHPLSRQYCAMAKRMATENGSEVCAMAMQLMGIEGLMAVTFSFYSSCHYIMIIILVHHRKLELKDISEISVCIKSWKEQMKSCIISSDDPWSDSDDASRSELTGRYRQHSF